MPEPTHKIRFEHIGVGVQTITLIGAVLFFVLQKTNLADQSAKDLMSFRAEVSAQFAEVKLQIAGLPDQRAAAVQLDRRMQDAAQRNADQDIRVTRVEQETYHIRADLDTLMRARRESDAKK